MAKGFRFVVKMTGLVVVHFPGDGHTGSFLGVRTTESTKDHPDGHGSGLSGNHSAHPHTATLAYPPTGLSGFNNRAVRAPDPLYADAYGSLFARRVLIDEILRIEPRWEDSDPHDLAAEIPNLVSLSKLDPRVAGVDPTTLGSDLAESPATCRLDVASGVLSEIEDEILAGPWHPREAGDTSSGQAEEFPALADALELTFEPVLSLTIHSNKRPALRFSTDHDEIVVSYTVEPAIDFEPIVENAIPHFDLAYNVVTWKDGRPEQPRKPFLTPDSSADYTIKDRACPPSKI